MRPNSRGEVACVYAAFDCGMGVLDKMMGYQGYLEDVLDQALAKLSSEHSPKNFAVIGEDAYMPDQPGKNRKGTVKIARRGLAQGIFGTAAIRIGINSLSLIASV